MYKVALTFHGELASLVAGRVHPPVSLTVACGRRSVKDLVESLGVPHSELGVIESAGIEVSPDAVIVRDESFQVHPFSSPGVWSVGRHGQEVFQFICDVHLGKLARNLRLLGFDTLYRNDWDDPDLARLSRLEKRILLSRDRRLLMRKEVVRGLYVRSAVPEHQVVEILTRLRLTGLCSPFTRCLACNGVLDQVDPKRCPDMAAVPIGIRERYSTFHRCTDCGRIFWKGSHHRCLRRRVENFLCEIREDG